MFPSEKITRDDLQYGLLFPGDDLKYNLWETLLNEMLFFLHFHIHGFQRFIDKWIGIKLLKNPQNLTWIRNPN